MSEPHHASEPVSPPSLSNISNDQITLPILFHGDKLSLTFAADATITDLSNHISETLSIPPSNQKFLVSPRPGLLKPPFPNPSLALSTLLTAKKITLLGASSHELESLHATIASIKSKTAARASAQNEARRALSSRPPPRTQSTPYTFASIKPLPYLRGPEKSLRYLERLANDPGIKASMSKHKFTVGLLTEMNPIEHTTLSGKTLGLNRNRGEVIELRLRTDEYDGYRDYKTIRKTLCHELAHNVWGEHDARFWKLCREIEGEVERGDWTRGGRSVGGEEFYNPHDQGVGDGEWEDEGGGWTGGSYVLGAAKTGERDAVGTVGEGMSRRDVIAKAAEERMKRQKDGEGGSSGT